MGIWEDWVGESPTCDVGTLFPSGRDSTENRKKKERKNKQPSPRPPQCCLSDTSECVKGCSWQIWCSNSVADPFASGCASEPPQCLWLRCQCVCWVLTHFNPLQSTQLNYAGNGLQIKLNINMLKMSLSSDKVAMHIKFLTQVH